MIRRLFAAACAACAVSLAAQTGVEADEACGASTALATARVEGEAYGSHAAEHALSDKLVFALAPRARGWGIEVRDAEGENLAVMTPPLSPPETNPTNIAGWHFRNADNTGPNDGEVNAPQAWRRFVFGPEALDPEALDPEALDLEALDPELAPPRPETVDPAVRPRFGRGELAIEDYGLADLAPGEEARMVYLRYSACLEWTPIEGESYVAGVPPAYPMAVQERFAACGLPPGFELSNHLGQGRVGPGASYLEIDVDADGAVDLAAPVIRVEDGKRGLAVCRAADGGALDVLGLEGGYGRHLVADYFDDIDWWAAAAPGPLSPSSEEGPPPTLAGEGVVIGKDDSSSALVYWDGQGWSSYWQGD